MESNGSVMLAPMSVPMATPWERLAAISATVNSGSEVPRPDIVVPMTASEMPTSRAISEANITRRSAA